MWKRYMDVCMGLLMLVMISMLAGKGVSVVKEAVTLPEEKKHIVVIDSGHGGHDPGKVGVNQAFEKDINLSIACKLRDKLTEAGVTVVMTRETDDGLYKSTDSNKKIADLNERCRIIEESGAEIVVSIHQNSYHSEGTSGPQVFYFENSKEGERLAQNLETAFTSISGNTRQSKANDNYFLLLHVACPVVIAECGFLSNWEEAQLLVTDEYQDQVAEALCQGILEYLASDTQNETNTKETPGISSQA